MKLYKIKHSFTHQVLFELKTSSFKLCVEAAISAGVSLSGANLSKAHLFEANLSGANLSKANLSEAHLFGANLFGANLFGANLYRANLSKADLSEANLFGANLFEANLSGAVNVSFTNFPSTRLLQGIHLGELSYALTLELMRRDAYHHPEPERFDIWAAGGNCPYQNEDRQWFFKEKRKLWKRGNPEMADRDLIIEICKEKGWGIDGYLKIEAHRG